MRYFYVLHVLHVGVRKLDEICQIHEYFKLQIFLKLFKNGASFFRCMKGNVFSCFMNVKSIEICPPVPGNLLLRV